MEKNNFAFKPINYILLAISASIIIVGFVLMSGSGSTDKAFNPDIFSVRRTKVAPAVVFVGFISVIGAILYRPKEETIDEENAE